MYLRRSEIELIFIEDYHDVPLKGLCRYNGYLCRFTVDHSTLWPSDREPKYNVRLMSFKEQIKALWIKWWFEFCVGHHWSYDKPDEEWKPKWLRKLLSSAYYKIEKLTAQHT